MVHPVSATDLLQFTTFCLCFGYVLPMSPTFFPRPPRSPTSPTFPLRSFRTWRNVEWLRKFWTVQNIRSAVVDTHNHPSLATFCHGSLWLFMIILRSDHVPPHLKDMGEQSAWNMTVVGCYLWVTSYLVTHKKNSFLHHIELNTRLLYQKSGIYRLQIHIHYRIYICLQNT